MLTRMTSIPAIISERRLSGDRDAGPIVATIFAFFIISFPNLAVGATKIKTANIETADIETADIETADIETQPAGIVTNQGRVPMLCVPMSAVSI